MYMSKTNKSAYPTVSKKMRTGRISSICSGNSFDNSDHHQATSNLSASRRLLDDEDVIINEDSRVGFQNAEEKENVSPMASPGISSSPTSTGIKRRHQSLLETLHQEQDWEDVPFGSEQGTSNGSFYDSESSNQGILLPRLSTRSQESEGDSPRLPGFNYEGQNRIPLGRDRKTKLLDPRPARKFKRWGPRPRWSPSPVQPPDGFAFPSRGNGRFQLSNGGGTAFSASSREISEATGSHRNDLPALALFSDGNDDSEFKNQHEEGFLSPRVRPFSGSISASTTPAATTPKAIDTVGLSAPATWYGRRHYQSPHWAGSVSVNPFSPVPPEYIMERDASVVLEMSTRSDPGASVVQQQIALPPRQGRMEGDVPRLPPILASSVSLSTSPTFADSWQNDTIAPLSPVVSTQSGHPHLNKEPELRSPTSPQKEGSNFEMIGDSEDIIKPMDTNFPHPQRGSTPPAPAKSINARSRFFCDDNDDSRCGNESCSSSGSSFSSMKIRETTSFSPMCSSSHKDYPISASVHNVPQCDCRMNDVFQNSEGSSVSCQGYSRFHNDFQVLGVLGDGSFGTVYECISRLDGCLYAVKVMNRAARGELDRERMLKEVYALAALCNQSHSATFHIVRYHQAWMEKKTLHIQTELCTSTLSHEMKAKGGTTLMNDKGKLFQLLRELLLALEFIHQNQMVHLDIKPENIFVKNGQFKLGDFGLASKVGHGGDFDEGDARYMSKELLSGKCLDATKCDIFSLGASMYEICLGRPLPSSGQEWHDIRSGKIALITSSSCPSELRDIISEMMHPDPLRRPSASELLQKRELLSPERRQLLEEQEKVREASLKLAAAQEGLLWNGAGDGKRLNCLAFTPPSACAMSKHGGIAPTPPTTATAASETSMSPEMSMMATTSLSSSKRCLVRSNSCSL